MVNYIYKARVIDNGKQIAYRNSKGEFVKFKPGRAEDYEIKRASILFNSVNKFFTGKDPNITPQEQVQIRAEIAKQFSPRYGGGKYYSALDVYKGIDFVLNTFSDEASEGGKNITPNEVYQIFEIFQSWLDYGQ